MASAERRVQHLHLAAASEAAARALLPRLEDALRCASLPGDGTRLVLVRRLKLRVRPGASAQALARHIEAGLGAVGLQGVDGAAVDAVNAAQVQFTSTLAACEALALRVLRGQPCQAWYWPRVAPGFVPTAAPAQNLACIARVLADSGPEAGVAVAAWRAVLVRHGFVASDEREWPPATSLATASAAAVAAVRGGEPDAAVAPLPRVRPGHLASTGSLLRAAGGVDGSEPQGTSGSVETADDRNAARPSALQPQMPGDGSPPRVSAGPAAESAQPALRRADGASGQDQSPASLPVPSLAIAPDGDADVPLHALGLPSTHAGLLFLLPVLARLGLPDWARVADADSAAWARAVLAAALDRLHAPPDEPLRRWLVAGRGQQLLLPLPRAAPAPSCLDAPALAAPRGRSPSALAQAWQDAPDAQVQAAVWLHAVRRWLRRGPRIGLASLVRRPGQVGWTPTHVDIHFDPRAAELRIRRHGLDVDAGWLPWLGCVLRFHYDGGGGV